MEDGRLDDRVAVVTGSTHGIGLAIAKRFAREGAAVVVNDEGAYDGERIVTEEIDGESIYVEADVRDPDAIDSLIDATVDEYGRIDVIVNNVGDSTQRYLTDATIEDWEFAFETSLRSSWLTVKHGIEHVPDGGSIVNISSTVGQRTVPRFFPYNVVKGAVDSLTTAMAVELGSIGIRANAIRPGAILVDDPDEDEIEQDAKVDPLGRWGLPEDVAPLAAFLASDESRYITGASIPVDGGRNAVLSGGQQVNKRPSRSDLGLSERG